MSSRTLALSLSNVPINLNSIVSLISDFLPVLSASHQSLVQAVLTALGPLPPHPLIHQLSIEVTHSLLLLRDKAHIQNIPLCYFPAIIACLWNRCPIAEPPLEYPVPPFPRELLNGLSNYELIVILGTILSSLVPLIPAWSRKIVSPVISDALCKAEGILGSSRVGFMAERMRLEIIAPISELRFIVQLIASDIDRVVDVVMGIDLLVILPTIHPLIDYFPVPQLAPPGPEEKVVKRVVTMGTRANETSKKMEMDEKG
jgi:hypothetical protein